MEEFKGLNLRQKSAVTYTIGPLVIVAGPGTGKTTTLVAKIFHLLQQPNTSPDEILVLTFTLKAAKEIETRVQKLSKGTGMPFIGTFHSLAFQTLTDYLPQFASQKIVSEQRKKDIIKRIRNSDAMLKDYSLKEIDSLISYHKTQAFFKKDCDPKLRKAVQSYNELLASNHLLDFDDLLIKCYELLKTDNKTRITLSKKFKYILIDEFQDTSILQYLIIKLLLSNNTNICVVGDPYQSIYSFRGSSQKIFDSLKKDFPNFKEIFLIENYRSCQNILDFYHQIFPLGPLLKTSIKGRGGILLIETASEYTEADWVVNKINSIVGGIDLNSISSDFTEDRQTSFKDFAVIYRIHSLSHVLQSKFHKSGIPYQIVGDFSIYEQKEIRFIVSLLDFLVNKSEESLREVMEHELSQQVCEKAVLQGEEKGLDLYTALKSLRWKITSRKQNTSLDNFLGQIDNLENEYRELSPNDLVKKIIKEFAIEENFEGEQNKLLSLQEFQNSILEFNKVPDGTCKFLSHLHELEQSDYYDQKCDKVTLLTIHAAKGLEFKHVFLCGFEEGIIPYTSKIKNTEDLNEEQRLLYVAVTRAKQGIYILSAKRRHNQQSLTSSFAKLFDPGTFQRIEDEAMVKALERKQKLKQKRSQISLFRN